MKKYSFLPLTLCLLSVQPLFSDDLSVIAQKGQAPSKNAVAQIYRPQDYNYLLGMPGFSDDALKLHFKLYQGYVTNTNLLLSLLDQYANKDKSPEYSELKRRLMWEFDGMRLHEDYFGNLGGKGTLLDPKDPLYKRMEQDFGSFEKWKTDFIATGLMRGIGWSVLVFDPVSNRLINSWINEHDRGHLPGGNPILIMDVFEHAYMIDYGIDRAKYIDAFFNNVDWRVVSSRFPKELKAGL